MRRYLVWASGWVGVAACVLAGCSGAPPAIPIQPIQSYGFRQTHGDVRVAVDPFFTPDRAGAAFSGGEGFPDKGLLPVQVIIENGSRAAVQVDPQNARLVHPNGRSEISLSAYDAFALVKIPVGWWALGAVVGASVPGYRNRERLRDIEGRALKAGTISPGQSEAGFVYFSLPEEQQSLDGDRVVLVLMDAGGREIPYEIPIHGQRDIPKPAKPVEAPPPQPNSRIQGGSDGIIIRSPAP